MICSLIIVAGVWFSPCNVLSLEPSIGHPWREKRPICIVTLKGASAPVTIQRACSEVVDTMDKERELSK